MSMENAYIVSLKFTPGLKKEFIVLGENLRKKGLNVKYMLAKSYKNFGYTCEGTEYITESDEIRSIIVDTLKFLNGKKIMKILSLYSPGFLCFYNVHPLNPFIARMVKKRFSKAVIALYLHDPFKPDKTPYGKGKAAYIALVECIQKNTVRYVDHVISPSEYSSQLFKRHYPKFKGETHIAPLIVPDQGFLKNKKRRYFSIVGGIHSATGHDTFVKLLNFAAEKELDYDFALISSSNISRYYKMLISKARKTLNVINRNIIADSEINKIVRESYAVFRFDREVTQSGVIPVAYMNGTPVIVRDIPGLRQHVKHRQNGYVVSYNCSPEDILEAMSFVKQNFSQLSENARTSYEITWSDRNWDKYYNWLSEIKGK